MYVRRYISDDATTSAVTCAFRYVPKTSFESQEKGELHALITLIGEDVVNADRLAKFVWDGIVDSYVYTKSSSPIDCLKKAIQDGSRKAVDLMKNEKDMREINLSFSLAVFKGKTSYLGIFGEQQLFLYKNGGFVKVSQIINQNRGVVASIALADEDIVLMSSPGILEAYAEISQMGLSPRELVQSVDAFADSLAMHQSILLISHKDLEIPELKERAVQAPVFEDIQVEAKEEEIQTDEIIHVEKKRLIDRLDLRGRLVRVKEIIGKIKFKLAPAFSKISFAFSSLGRKIAETIGDKYGRQLWYKRLMSNFSMFKLRGGANTVGVKIDGYKITNKRNRRILTLILAIILIIVVWGGVKLSINASQSRKTHKIAVVMLDDLQKYVESGEKNVQTDEEVTQLSIFSANEEVVKLADLKLSIDDALRFSTLKDRLLTLNDRLELVKPINDKDGTLETFIIGRTAFGDKVKLSDIVAYKNENQQEYIFLTDKGNLSVYQVSLANKSSISIPDSKKLLSSPEYIDYSSEGVYVYDSQVGVLRSTFSKGTNKSFDELSGLSADELGGTSVADMIVTDVGNIYILDTKREAILKATKAGGGYGFPSEYVSSKSFSLGKDLMIDFSIYTLSTGSKGLERFSYNYGKNKTVANPVSVSGLNTPFSNLIAGCTTGLVKGKLYAFDADTKRIIAFEKPIESGEDARHPNEMVLVAQYVYRGDRNDVFVNVKDIVTDYKEENMYILDGDIVWKMSLK